MTDASRAAREAAEQWLSILDEIVADTKRGLLLVDLPAQIKAEREAADIMEACLLDAIDVIKLLHRDGCHVGGKPLRRPDLAATWEDAAAAYRKARGDQC